MSLSNRILIIAGVILALTGLSFIIYKQIENSNRQQAIETQVVSQKELINNVMRSQNDFATKDDINKFITASGINLKSVQDDLSKLQATVASVNSVTVTSAGQKLTSVISTSIGPNNNVPIDPKNPDPYGYMNHQENLDLNEDFSGTKVPIGQVGFSAWQKAPWDINILPRQYTITNVVGTDENQREYFYNKVTVKVNDKNYDVKIASSETKQEYPTAKFSFWNPKLFMTLGGAANVNNSPIQPNVNIGLGLNIMSYGKYKLSPDINVLGLGAGYAFGKNEFIIILNPVSYNIGRLLPGNIISNTYLGPSIQFSIPNETVFVGGNLSLNL